MQRRYWAIDKYRIMIYLIYDSAWKLFLKFGEQVFLPVPVSVSAIKVSKSEGNEIFTKGVPSQIVNQWDTTFPESEEQLWQWPMARLNSVHLSRYTSNDQIITAQDLEYLIRFTAIS